MGDSDIKISSTNIRFDEKARHDETSERQVDSAPSKIKSTVEKIAAAMFR